MVVLVRPMRRVGIERRDTPVGVSRDAYALHVITTVRKDKEGGHAARLGGDQTGAPFK